MSYLRWQKYITPEDLVWYDPAMPKDESVLHLEIVGGPNGSGKTTFARSYLAKALKRPNYMNPDAVASGLSSVYSPETAFKAGRIFLVELKERIRQKETFSFETTLSGLSYLRLVREARANGYKITIYFLFTDSTKTNLARIKRRVSLGGHNIPTKDVVRRYRRSFANFWLGYRELADHWAVFDNSKSVPKCVMVKEAYSRLSEEERLAFEKKFLKGKV